jgi:prevent-host-death family protein
VRTAGIREARQNLSTLLDEVKQGREVVITDRGRPVARLVPPDRLRRGVPDLSAFRKTMPLLEPPLSATIAEDREDRL